MLLRWTRLHDLPVLGQEALFSRRSRMFYIRAKTFPGNRGCTKNCSRCRRPLPTVGRVVDQPARSELFVHRQVQGDVEGADECIAAIGITAEIGFRHSGYQVEDSFAACQDRCEGQEYHVTSRNEGVRVAVCRFFLIH